MCYLSDVATIPTKQLLQQLIDDLPDDCTIEDAQYRLYVLGAVERGRADLAAGRTIPHDVVVADLGRRWGKNREH
jgi:predicted transcriptional regulator